VSQGKKIFWPTAWLTGLLRNDKTKMKESALYLDFIKRNLLILIIPLLTGILASSFLLSQVTIQTKIAQSFKMIYNPADLNQSLALTDQAVAELRSQKFASLYPSASTTIYKSGPLLISIEAVSADNQTAYGLLLKETGYLTQNFSVTQITQPVVTRVEPSAVKYLLTGMSVGFLIGLVSALIKEYLKNY